jgi:hypothetical protein
MRQPLPVRYLQAPPRLITGCPTALATLSLWTLGIAPTCRPALRRRPRRPGFCSRRSGEAKEGRTRPPTGGAFVSPPEDGRRIPVDLLEEVLDRARRGQLLVAVELEIAVSPIQRPHAVASAPQTGDWKACPVQYPTRRVPRRPALGDRDRRRTDVDFDTNLVEQLDGDAPAGPLEDLVDLIVGNDDLRTLTPRGGPRRVSR